MRIEVAVYGREIAPYVGGKHLAQRWVELREGATLRDLLTALGIPPEKVGLVFINAVLHDLPGLHLSLGDPLHPNDHVGLFAADYVWPYHYRGGAPMSPRLQAYVRSHDYLRHHPRRSEAGFEDSIP